MASIPQLAAATSATAPFAALRVDTSAYSSVVISCNTLTTDTVTIKHFLPDETSCGFQFNNAAVVLATGKEAVQLPGGPVYTFVKSATTDTVNIFLTPIGRTI